MFFYIQSCQVPDSYHYKRRVHLYDTAARAQSQPCSVDTSDLGVKEEDWYTDEAAATLLGYAEKEVMGHKVKKKVWKLSIGHSRTGELNRHSD